MTFMYIQREFVKRKLRAGDTSFITTKKHCVVATEIRNRKNYLSVFHSDFGVIKYVLSFCFTP